MQKLYVITSERSDNKCRLIGELTNDNGEYKFEYKIGGAFSAWYLKIKEFPNPDKIYQGEIVHKFIQKFIPDPIYNSTEYLIKQANLKKYDVWEMLKVFGKRNHTILIVTELSENIVRCI